LTDVNGTLFFSAEDGVHGTELWQSDGIPDGTMLVKDIHPGIEDSMPRYLTDVDGTSLFSADDGVHGQELWALDTWEPYLWIDPPEVDLPIGYEFTVDIMVSEVRDLYGVELQLSFDPALAEVVDSDPEVEGVQVQPGDCPLPDSVVANSADNTAGTISYAVEFLSPSLPCQGSGVIASATFRGLAEGISPLHFSDFLLTDEELNPISVESVQDGSLNVYQAAGITVTPTSSLVTTEGGGSDTFTVVLDSQPSEDVLIRLTSSDPSEGTASHHWLFFSSSSWDRPKTVTVTGTDDFVDDGDIPYTIITDPAISSDPNYGGLDAADVSVTNIDDDVAGITVIPTSDLVTTEKGGSDTFTVVLDSQPLAEVTIGLSSSDTSEGTVDPTSLTFTPAEWNTLQVATIIGADDGKVDGDITYTILTDPAVSDDPIYDGLDAEDVSVTNIDDDMIGVEVIPTSGLVTSEGGATDSFTVVLTSQPSADVIIGLSSSNTAEGTLSRHWLIFTSTTWNNPKSVTVTGVDDAVDDGDTPYLIITAPAISNDRDYKGFDADDVLVTNVDDDGHGITVTPPNGLVTSEGGDMDTFFVKLDSQPVAHVTIGLSSSDASEGTVTPQWLTFSPTNWNTPKSVNVVGIDDFVDDGDVGYTIITAPAISADANYNGENAVDISVTNKDDDVAGIMVTPFSGLETSEDGDTDTFTVVLGSQPTADVIFGLTCSDTTEGMIAKDSLTFTALDWNTPQQVVITGMDDTVVDGDIVYMILTASAGSADLNYNGLNAVDVSVTNLDNDEPVFNIFLPLLNGE
jgi:ELWxxDGT repeat protein